MKVLMVMGSTSWSGGEAVAYSIATELSAEQESVFVVLGTPRGDTKKRYLPFRVVATEDTSIGRILGLRKALLEEKPDVVHAHGTRAKLFLILAYLTLEKRPPTIYTVHGFHIAYRTGIRRALALWLERCTNRWVNQIVAVSQADLHLMRSLGVIKQNTGICIYNGIAPYSPDPSAANLFRKSIKHDGLLGVVIARLHPQKDIATAIHAWKLVAQTQPEAQLVVLGDGPLRSDLEQLITSLNLSANIKLLGYRPDTRAALDAADIVILPTHWEGLAVVALEAGAAGKPLIATAVPGMDEVIQDHITGLLVREGDPKNLATHCTALFIDPEKRIALGNAAREFIAEKFSIAEMSKAHLKQYALLTTISTTENRAA